jgi:hypothetical protein
MCEHKPPIRVDYHWARLDDGSGDLALILNARCLHCGAHLYFEDPIVWGGRKHLGVKIRPRPKDRKRGTPEESDYRNRN